MRPGPSNWYVANTQLKRWYFHKSSLKLSRSAVLFFTHRQEIQTPAGASQQGRQPVLCVSPGSIALRLSILQPSPGLQRTGGCMEAPGRAGRGQGVTGRCQGEPHLVSVPLPPPRRERETCAQVIVMNGKPGSTCCHLPGPGDTCAELAGPDLPKLETTEPPRLPGNGV